MNNPYDDKRVVVDAIGGKNEPLLFGEQGGGGGKPRRPKRLMDQEMDTRKT